MSRHRPAINCGTPDLTEADVPGTALLLSARGTAGTDPAGAARARHRAVAIDLARRHAARPGAKARLNLRATSLTGEDPWADDPAEAAEVRDLVTHLLSRLTPEEKALLHLRVERDLPFEAIAQELKTPLRTVESHWRRLRIRAQELLKH